MARDNEGTMRRGIPPGKDRVERLVRWAWSQRVEILMIYGAWFIWVQLSYMVGPAVALVIMFALAGVAYACKPFREMCREWYAWSRLRRRFIVAARMAGIVNAYDQVPRPVEYEETAVGMTIRVRMAPGSHAGDLEDGCEALAACLGCREVRVARDRRNAAFAELVLVQRDPLAGNQALAWPLLEAERLSLWDPIPVGLTEAGNDAMVSLPERNVLLGGEPGGGKSVALSQLVAAAALDPEVGISLFDGKRVELSVWKGCAERFVGPSIDDAIEALGELRDDMEARYEWLETEGRRKITRQDRQFALRIVFVDELALFTADPTADRKTLAELAGLLRDLVARGRAAGIIVVAATQKPSSDIVPTSLRDLFGFRWAMRCSTPQASDTILGQGWASLGFSATSIDSKDRGVGFLLAEGAEPVRLRSFYLSDDDLAAIARRAEALRAQHAGEEPGVGDE